jgi:hypothetical protein
MNSYNTYSFIKARKKNRESYGARRERESRGEEEEEEEQTQQ